MNKYQLGTNKTANRPVLVTANVRIPVNEGRIHGCLRSVKQEQALCMGSNDVVLRFGTHWTAWRY